ncbi:iron-sulfur cluster co-chaperone protein HscB-like [Patiria miniata]|uniref:J domain-containing protein n=1 Tax=Patiria miniata TaxID=46514 RepID=A0A914A5X3_PATMI|nr:iron-sulfur cluster co-chaperone protein HscB-like [Patiria miniata]
MAAPMSVFKLVRSDLKLIRFCIASSQKPTSNHNGVISDSLCTNKVAEIERHWSIGAKINDICESRPTTRWNHTLRKICSTGGSWQTSRTKVSISHRRTFSTYAFNPQDGHPGISGGTTGRNVLSVGKQSLQPAHFRLYCTVSRTCWNCHALTELVDKSEVQFFCDACNAIQPLNPDSNFFQTMQCDETFDLDTAKLRQTFRNLQRKLHPDKFSVMSKEEQDYSAMQSSEVNKAYSTLLKPLSRGLYLLELNGLTIEEGDSGIEAEFLMEVMDTNETLAETEEEATVRRIGEENAVKLEFFLKNLSQAFSERNYPLAREILMRLKYFSNIDDKVKDRLEKDF